MQQLRNSDSQVLPFPFDPADPVDAGDRALLSCELFGLLSKAKLVPTQKECDGSMEDFVARMEPHHLPLKHFAESIAQLAARNVTLDIPEAQCVSREEGATLNALFETSGYAHSSMQMKDFLAQLKQLGALPK